MTEHVRDTEPKARKQKKCFLCGMTIEIGEVHVVRTIVDSTEGTISSFAMHYDCSRLADEFYNDWAWECHDEADFREEYLESRLD